MFSLQKISVFAFSVALFGLFGSGEQLQAQNRDMVVLDCFGFGVDFDEPTAVFEALSDLTQDRMDKVATQTMLLEAAGKRIVRVVQGQVRFADSEWSEDGYIIAATQRVVIIYEDDLPDSGGIGG